MSKKQALISLILNSLIVLGTTGVVISYFFIKLDYLDSPFQRFCFFTTDSNILSAIAAVVVVIFDIKILRGKITHCLTSLSYSNLSPSQLLS